MAVLAIAADFFLTHLYGLDKQQAKKADFTFLQLTYS